MLPELGTKTSYFLTVNQTQRTKYNIKMFFFLFNIYYLVIKFVIETSISVFPFLKLAKKKNVNVWGLIDHYDSVEQTPY